MTPLKVGETAPDFELSGVLGDKRRTFRLSDYRGKNVILVFYVLDWSPV